MNTLLYLAQATETITVQGTNLTESEIAVALAVIIPFLIGMFFFIALIALASYIVSALCLMSIFKKAGQDAWPAWVPVYNTWKTLEIGGQKGFWSVLFFVPIVNIVAAVYYYIAQYHIGLRLGKSGAFLLWAIFLPIVWYIWLAVDKSTWNESAAEVQGQPETPTQSLESQDQTTPERTI